MKKLKTNAVTEAAFMAALSIVFSFIIVWTMPQGGSVTVGCMLPIFLITFRRGAIYGILTGVVSGLLQFLASGITLHPLSIILDYILAYAVIGTAGCGGIFRKGHIRIAAGTALGCLMRFSVHFISGGIIFAAYAPPAQNPWIYSALYNTSYMIPETCVTLAEVLLLYTFAKRLFHV